MIFAIYNPQRSNERK